MGFGGATKLANFLPVLAALCVVIGAPRAAGQTAGVTPDTVTIGRLTSVQGPAGAKGAEQQAALVAYFEDINRRGGVHGRRLLLQTVDDPNPANALGHARRLYETDRVFAYFMISGTAASQGVVSYATPLGIPVVAPNTGAEVFHSPVNPLVFNVRAKYRAEVISAIKHFSTLGLKRLALVHVNDAFGNDGLAGFNEGVPAHGITPVFVGTFDLLKGDASKHVPALIQTKPDAVICVGASKTVAELIKSARAAGTSATFMTLSNNSSNGFIKELGSSGRGVIVSQVTPPPTARTSRLSQELIQLLSSHKDAQLSYAAMEAYASAKVLVEGLKRAGRNLTHESFVQALESMTRLDLGGMEVGYGRGDRTGSAFVELTMIAADGRFIR
jgi:branched-chain amino acid transport system substrate-binding protein